MNVLANQLIRPYRFVYNLIDLGKKKTAEYIREDSYILNDKAQRLYYSYYKNNIPSDTCVVYAHCNSGCRIEGLQYVKYFAEKGWNVLLFDFSGSGLSEGETISLGYQEAKDLRLLIQEMQKKGNNMFFLWGRSMGASTIIFYLNEFPDNASIIGCVLDSPYSSLWRLSVEIGVSMTGMPNFLITGVLSLLRSKILDEHKFDIKAMNPLSLMKSIKCPIMFITSLKDQLVNSEHVVELYKAFEGVKRLEYIDSTHNSSRQEGIIKLATDYLDYLYRKKKLQCAKLEAKGQEMAKKVTHEFKQFRKFKSFKIIRQNPFKQNQDINHTQHFEQPAQQLIANKLRNRSKISQLQNYKLRM